MDCSSGPFGARLAGYRNSVGSAPVALGGGLGPFLLLKEAVSVRSGCWVHGFHAILLRTPSSWVGPNRAVCWERRSRHPRCGVLALGLRGAVSEVYVGGGRGHGLFSEVPSRRTHRRSTREGGERPVRIGPALRRRGEITAGISVEIPANSSRRS